MIALQVLCGAVLVGFGFSFGGYMFSTIATEIIGRYRQRQYMKAVTKDITAKVQAQLQAQNQVTFTVIPGGKGEPEPGTN